MTNFSTSPGHCQLLFFKPAGKWKYELTLDMGVDYNDLSAPTAVANAIARTQELRDLHKHHWALVVEPYHRNAIPVLLPPTELSISDVETLQAAVRYNAGELAHAGQ